MKKPMVMAAAMIAASLALAAGGPQANATVAANIVPAHEAASLAVKAGWDGGHWRGGPGFRGGPHWRGWYGGPGWRPGWRWRPGWGWGPWPLVVPGPYYYGPGPYYYEPAPYYGPRPYYEPAPRPEPEEPPLK